jgi:hypothetical protein
LASGIEAHDEAMLAILGRRNLFVFFYFKLSWLKPCVDPLQRITRGDPEWQLARVWLPTAHAAQ